MSDESDNKGLHTSLDVRFHLLDPDAMLALARVMYEGEQMGRGRGDWRKVSCDDHLNHAFAHMWEHLRGDHSEDHLAHAMCQLMMAWATDKHEARSDHPYSVYICHPFSDDPEFNTQRAIRYALYVKKKRPNVLIIVPHTLVGPLYDDSTQRGDAMIKCKQLVRMVDELIVCGLRVTEGMDGEMLEAEMTGKLITKEVLPNEMSYP